jgi:hypothetical protein
LNQFAGTLDWQSLQYDLIDEAEDCRICANAKRQGCDRNKSKEGRFDQAAYCGSKFIQDALHGWNTRDEPGRFPTGEIVVGMKRLEREAQ